MARELPVVIGSRVTETERAAIELAARAEQMTVSQFVREAAVSRASEALRERLRIDKPAA